MKLRNKKNWEGVEEPEEYWTIDRSEKGGLFVHKVAELAMLPEWVECDEKCGIRFETEEEAEQAVEKLKAFTNLKKHGFAFDGWYYGAIGDIVILTNAHEFNDMEEQDLIKVFGEKI